MNLERTALSGCLATPTLSPMTHELLFYLNIIILVLRASLVAQLVKNPPEMWETWVRPLCWEDPWRSERLPTPIFWHGEFHGLYSIVHGIAKS